MKMLVACSVLLHTTSPLRDFRRRYCIKRLENCIRKYFSIEDVDISIAVCNQVDLPDIRYPEYLGAVTVLINVCHCIYVFAEIYESWEATVVYKNLNLSLLTACFLASF